jgi:outer membrane lipoprotein-sorting protein
MKVHRIALAALAASFLTLSAPALALSPEEKGLQIAQESDRRNEGFGDSLVSMRMVLRNPAGDTSVREMRTRTLEVKADGDKSLIVFDQPRDVAGTALLTHTHKSADDDRWLFLPAVKRVKRIASANKSGPFMGSEFAYEDLGSQEVEKYRYEFLREEKLNGLDCFVYNRFPVDATSGYMRQVVWVDKAEYRAQKLEFYDRKASLLKTLTFKGYEQYLGKYWRPAQMDMVNHQTGKSTTLTFQNYKFRNGYRDQDLDQSVLTTLR